MSDKFFKRMTKTGIEDNILFHYKIKEEAQMQRKMKGKRTRLTGVAKLEDANMAGKKDAELCTLILTEGDSAKSLAMSGMEIIGRDNYGVFPLKGKFLNVRDATNKQIMDNSEVTSLIKIIGLQLGKVYEDKKTLRYGSVMIMADQDADGSHIKGLVINFFHKFWPSLIRCNNFLKEFVTPILKAKKGETTKSFFTLNDFKEWAEHLGDDIKKWKIKYYKGLGTSTDKEAKEYFSALRKHKLNFEYTGIEDDQAIDLVFNKKKADDRKVWLKDSDPDAAVDHNEDKLTYTDFVHKELVHFSRADCLRAIPNIIDGLKTSQRKILFACFKRKLTGEIKVAQ
jgi:DNA topoisomerase-2